MKITLAQLNYTIGDIAGNTQKIIDAIARAKNQQCDIVCFSELAICGYSPKDMLDYPSFIKRCEDALEEVKSHSDNIGVLVGAPRWSHLQKGKKLYNSAFFFHNQETLGVIDKTLLPTYDIFEEYRYFEPNSVFEILEFKGERLAITICEDLWNLGEEGLYKTCPMNELMAKNPSMMINLSGSPYSYNHVEDRRHRMQENARHYKLPLFYVNQIGANTDILFDGGSMFINESGEIVGECAFFSEDLQTYTWEAGIINEDNHQDYQDHDIALIHKALVMGVKDYFQKTGLKKAILGSSGGIDSAVVHALAAEALDSENITAILMPSQYSSKGSVVDAEQLAKNLNSPYHIVPIAEPFDGFKSALTSIFKGHSEDVTEENLQARSRGVILMAISNKLGGIVLNTSNKSESAVGYTTLYGDMCGGLSVIGDLYKEQVYEMARYINRNKEIIPLEIINKAPSAELRPDQKDSDSLPPYPILDKILFHYIEERLGSLEIVALGFEEKLVKKVIKMVDFNEFKRFQAAPTLRISHKAFGVGRRMPIVAKYLS